MVCRVSEMVCKASQATSNPGHRNPYRTPAEGDNPFKQHKFTTVLGGDFGCL